jgi:hypothetical protein
VPSRCGTRIPAGPGTPTTPAGKAIRKQILACGAALLTSACVPSLHSAPPAPSIGAVEAAYAALREAEDAIDALESQLPGAEGRHTLAEWRRLYSERRGLLTARLGALSPVSLAPDDQRAADAIRHALERDLPPLEPAVSTNAAQGPSPCEAVHSGGLSVAILKQALFACFAEAAGRIQFEGRTLDRLSALGELAKIPEPGRRKTLFLAMEPLWRAVNGDGDATSPYRRLVALTAAQLEKGESAVDSASRGLGIDAAATERWLVAILDAWREATPTDLIEPWNFRYLGGEPSRLLSPSIPLQRLREINDRYYRDLGADPLALRVQYDLAPRPGKDPVAYTSFLFRGFTTGASGNLPSPVFRRHTTRVVSTTSGSCSTRPATRFISRQYELGRPSRTGLTAMSLLKPGETCRRSSCTNRSGSESTLVVRRHRARRFAPSTTPSFSTWRGGFSKFACSAIRQRTPIWYGPTSPRRTYVSCRIPSGRGGPCVVSSSMRPGTC